MVQILNAAFGGDTTGKPTPPPGAKGVPAGFKDLTEGHSDVHSAVAAINAAFRI